MRLRPAVIHRTRLQGHVPSAVGLTDSSVEREGRARRCECHDADVHGEMPNHSRSGSVFLLGDENQHPTFVLHGWGSRAGGAEIQGADG